VFNTAGSQALYAYNDNTNYNPSSPSSSSSFTATVKNQLIVTKAAVDGSYSITVSADPTYAGTVTGGGDYSFGDVCTLTAVPNPGYYFTGWTENGQVVSTDRELSFSVIENRTLVATFLEGVMVGEGTLTNTHLPSLTNYKYSLSQQLYTADEIGTAGTITAISFYNGGAEKTRNFDVYLVLTDKEAFTSKKDWITVSSGDKVFSGEVTMVADGWTKFTLNTPFAYDGTSNLAVIIDDNTGESSTSPHMACRVFNTDSKQALYIHSNSTDFDPLSPPEKAQSNNNLNNTAYVKNQLFFNIVTAGTLELSNDGKANETAINEAAATGKPYDVTLSGRTLYKDGEWNTLCLPFNVTLADSPLSGATAKTLADATMNNTHVSLTFGEAVTELEAGVPYIIKWEGGDNIVNPEFKNVTISEPVGQTLSFVNGNVKFIGYYNAFDITPDDTDIYYMTAGNTLKHTGKPRTLKACRAYFQFSAEAMKRIQQFVLDFGGDVTTGIISIDNEKLNESGWYTVDGKKLEQQPTRKGLYIHNGVKVVIK